MNAVFIDTVALHALNSPRDQYYLRCLIIIKKLQKTRVHLVTTDYVVSETATNLLTTVKGGYKNAVNFLHRIFSPAIIIDIEWITSERFQNARKVFERYNKDKFWSFTDCTSYVVLKELKIQKVFTFDQNFKQMGFSLL